MKLPYPLKTSRARIENNSLIYDIELEPDAAELYLKINLFVSDNKEHFYQVIKHGGTEAIINFFKLCLEEWFEK